MIAIAATDAFRHAPPAPDLIAGCRDVGGERLALGARELYVDYGDGIRFTKLKISGKEDPTGQNMNSVRKMARMMGMHTFDLNP